MCVLFVGKPNTAKREYTTSKVGYIYIHAAKDKRRIPSYIHYTSDWIDSWSVNRLPYHDHLLSNKDTPDQSTQTTYPNHHYPTMSSHRLFHTLVNAGRRTAEKATSQKYLLLTNTFACGCLLGAGDVAAQTIEKYSRKRTKFIWDKERTGQCYLSYHRKYYANAVALFQHVMWHS